MHADPFSSTCICTSLANRTLNTYSVGAKSTPLKKKYLVFFYTLANRTLNTEVSVWKVYPFFSILVFLTPLSRYVRNVPNLEKDTLFTCFFGHAWYPLVNGGGPPGAASQRLSSHRRVHNKLSRCCTICYTYRSIQSNVHVSMAGSARKACHCKRYQWKDSMPGGATPPQRVTRMTVTTNANNPLLRSISRTFCEI